MIPVWVYWTGPTWPHIDRCLQTIRLQCEDGGRCEMRLVDDQTFPGWVHREAIHPDWQKIHEPGVRSDLVRAALLAEHGGVYLDADTICLRDPGLLATERQLRFATWSTPPDRVIAGYLAANGRSWVARAWLEAINEMIEVRGAAHVGWLDLGERVLTPLVRAAPQYVEEMPLETVLPIEIDREVERFFEPEDWRPWVRPHTVCFGLNHSWFVSRRPGDFRDPLRWPESPLLIHRLLCECMAQQEDHDALRRE